MTKRWPTILLALVLAICQMLLFVSPAWASDKYDHYEDTGSANALVYAAHHYAQTFTANTTFTLTSVKLDMHRAGTDAPAGTVSIRTTDSSGHPSYSDILSTASFASSTITLSWV